MDFFYVTTYVNGFSPGLQNAFVGGSFSPVKDCTINAHYHYMATATNLPNTDMTLGHCIDLDASYDIRKDISLSAGISYMTGTKTMEKLKRANDDGSLKWAWLSVKFKPSIITQKW